MKRCFKCGEAKPEDAFYRHAKMADGRLGKCITCTKRDVRENRSRNLEAYRAKDRERASEKRRVPARSEYQKTAAGKAAGSRAKSAWAKRNPEKRRAQVAVGNAVRDGVLRRMQCEDCGADKAQAHHDDYSKPMDVRWKCSGCHAKHHRDERNASTRGRKENG